MELSVKAIADINVLIGVAEEIKVAEENGDSKAFKHLEDRYGPLVFGLYNEVAPQKDVVLPVWTVRNRALSCSCAPDTLDFWMNGDTILGIYDFLKLEGIVKDGEYYAGT